MARSGRCSRAKKVEWAESKIQREQNRPDSRFREKRREPLCIAEILLEEVGAFKLCDVFKSAD
jgi:hypothetical protein